MGAGAGADVDNDADASADADAIVDTAAGGQSHARAVEIANGKRCTADKWLNIYKSDPSKCMDEILARSDCSHTFFNHASNGDGNCGYITDKNRDCTVNTVNHNAVRVYRVAQGV